MSIDLRKLARLETAVLTAITSLRDSDARLRKLRLNLAGARTSLSILRGDMRAYGISEDLRSEGHLAEDITKWEREFEAEMAANAEHVKTVETTREIAENCRRHAEANRPKPAEAPYDLPRHRTHREPGTAPIVARSGGMAADIRNSLADGAPRAAATSSTPTRRT